MKVLVLFLSLFLITSFAFADASFEVVKTDIDNNGNIRVWSCHKVDGSEIVSQYPKIDGKSVYCSRYNKMNFKDCVDKKAIETYILNDIKNYSNVLIQKEFDKKAPKTLNQIKIDYNASANQSFATTNLDELVGKKLTTTETSHKIDTDNDSIMDVEIKIKTNGEKTITPLIIP